MTSLAVSIVSASAHPSACAKTQPSLLSPSASMGSFVVASTRGCCCSCSTPGFVQPEASAKPPSYPRSCRSDDSELESRGPWHGLVSLTSL